MGYYEIKDSVFQQNLTKYFRFKSTDALSEQFNKFVNNLKKDKEGTANK